MKEDGVQVSFLFIILYFFKGLKSVTGNKVTMLEYYSFTMSVRGYDQPEVIDETSPGSGDRPKRRGRKRNQIQLQGLINDGTSKFSPILYGGKLFQQYLVDAYVRVEQDRLDYHRYSLFLCNHLTL